MDRSISERKELANSYRKKGDFDEAIPLYESLWRETADPFDGIGLLCCYRKSRLFDKAIPLAEELCKEHTDLTWAAREICWTLIQGKLQIFDESTPLEEVIKISDTVLKYSPDFLAKKLAVFKVLKWAKKKDDWDIIGSWVDRIEPDSLSIEPMHFDSGREGWSDQCLWYNYKINSLLKVEAFGEARKNALVAQEKCPKQRLFFVRLQAHAMKGIGDIEGAQSLYENLCNKKRPEWWLLHEYGNLLKEVGETDKALFVLCKAAFSNRKLEMMVKLFSDLAQLFLKKGDPEKARAHCYLEKFVRDENGWPISSSLATSIDRLDSEMLGDSAPLSKQEAFSICRTSWKVTCGNDTSETRTKKKDLVGQLTIPKNRPFCFVNTKDGLSAICFSKDMPDDVANGDTVIFDVIPSFDKKKNRESWKAIKIRRFNVRKK
jgi:tetratricopeptide (TPR) repeat protein